MAFLEPNHGRRLPRLAGMKGVSKSAIVAAALSSYLSPDGGDWRQAASKTARRQSAEQLLLRRTQIQPGDALGEAPSLTGRIPAGRQEGPSATDQLRGPASKTIGNQSSRSFWPGLMLWPR